MSTFPLEASLSQAPNDELAERWGLRRQTGTVASSSNPAPLHGWHGGIKATHLEPDPPQNFSPRLGICEPLARDQRTQESSGKVLAFKGGYPRWTLHAAPLGQELNLRDLTFAPG